MFDSIFYEFSNIISKIIIAVIFCFIFFRTSYLWLGINLIEETKQKNQAVAIFCFGFMVMLGIIIGLFKV